MNTKKYAIVAPYRGTFYISLKSGAILRWVARETRGDYHTLTTNLWRKAGLKGDPTESNPTKGSAVTYYFDSETAAQDAISTFLCALRGKGISLP